MPSIVTINVSQTVAPTPNTLQSTGALISQGGTTLGTNTSALLTQASDLTALLSPAVAISSLVYSGGTVVATTPAPIPGMNTGDVFITTIAGASPTGYNGTVSATVTGANTFTYQLASDPGTNVTPGNYTPPSVGELQAMVNTFFAQGAGQAVYVFELGAGDDSDGPGKLQTWLGLNPGIFYSFLVPRGWDGATGLLNLIALYSSPTSKLYFFVTTTTGTYTTYTATMKCVFAMVEAPAIPITEFSAAAPFQHWLAYAPDSTNRMTPFSFSFLFGVTAYPTSGNQALLTTLKGAATNYVGTGAEGGISTQILLWGTLKDGNDATYWYEADWVQIQSDLAISNAVINGSNNPLNPLYYNQPGINVLQDVVVQVLQDAVTFGIANGNVAQTSLDGPVFQQNLDDGLYADTNVVNAVPFVIYTAENPSAYKQGVYGGLSVVFIPQRGFTEIIFNINVTQFLNQ